MRTPRHVTETPTHRKIIEALVRAKDAGRTGDRIGLEELRQKYGGPEPGSAGGIVRRWPELAFAPRKSVLLGDGKHLVQVLLEGTRGDRAWLLIRRYYRECRALRKKWVKHGTLNLGTGVIDYDSAEWREEECRLPIMHGEDAQWTGVCRTCLGGWMCHGNRPIPMARFERDGQTVADLDALLEEVRPRFGDGFVEMVWAMMPGDDIGTAEFKLKRLD